jgi:transcriptional regulator with XRE-family HTH domain
MKYRNNQTFGMLIKSLRKSQGYSIKSLSSRLGINFSYISKIENNRSNPSEDLIVKIADIFNYDKEELMIRAGKLPEDIVEILKNNPKAAADFLRTKFSKYDGPK